MKKLAALYKVVLGHTSSSIPTEVEEAAKAAASEVGKDRELYVDATNSEEGNIFSTVAGPNEKGMIAPFMVFDADQQQNIAGPFKTYDEAEKHRKEILAGVEPKLDGKKLSAWLDKLDAENDSLFDEVRMK